MFRFLFTSSQSSYTFLLIFTTFFKEKNNEIVLFINPGDSIRSLANLGR